MEEILPGLLHWTTTHERWDIEISSYWLVGEGVLIDPCVPEDGFDRFEQAPPREILLTVRHHFRHSDRFAERYGCSVHSHRDGLHEFASGETVAPFMPGDRFADGAVVVQEVGAICPDEVALHIPGTSALACGDGVVKIGEEGVRAVSDDLLGDDPDGVRAGLRTAYARLLDELDFEHVLLAHGGPLIGTGRQELASFAQRG